VLIAYAFQGVLDFIRSRVLLHFSAAVDVDLSGDVHKLMSASWRAHRRQMDSLQPMRDLDQLQAVPGRARAVCAGRSAVDAVFIVILFLLHPYLGIAVLIGGAVLIFLTFLTERLTSEKNQKLMALAGTRQMVADITRRHSEVAVRARHGRDASRPAGAWRAGSSSPRRKSSMPSRSSLSNLTKILRMVLQSGVLTVGALLVMEQKASGGVIFASSILSSRALAPVEAAIANWRGFVGARQGWARFKALILAMPKARAPTCCRRQTS
jgi:ABC-type protease/lipase transport system fused ATPase/permease subunit